MTTYIVLLRGVMPSGKNRVPMAQLRQLLTDAGFEAVHSWIQSGNIILRTSLSALEVEQQVQTLIKTHIGADLVVVVRTPTQLQTILDSNPFGEGYDRARVFYTVLASPPPPEKVKELLAQDFSPEALAITEPAAYLYVPGNAGRSKLSNNLLEKKLGVSATTRNYNTISKMLQLSLGEEYQ